MKRGEIMKGHLFGHKHWTALLALSSLGLVPLGCGKSSSQDPSQLKHDTDQPVRGHQAYQWVEMDRDGYSRYVAPIIGQRFAQFLEGDHELVERLQFWIDEFDRQIRQEHPQKMQGVPKPKGMVKVASSANAFVAPAPVCYDIPVKFSGQSGGGWGSSSNPGRVFLDASTGDFGTWPGSIQCVDGGQNADVIAGLAETINKSDADCHLSVENQGGEAVLVAGSSCELSNNLQGVSGASGVGILQTAPFVTVHSGIVSSQTEKSFAGVVAHELGHYYRSHINTPEGMYGYYYELKRQNRGHKPEPDPSLKSFGKEAYKASQFLTVADLFTRFEGQKLRSELFMAVGSIVDQVCSEGSEECPRRCQEASDYMTSSSFTNAVGLFPFADESSDMKEAYSRFEDDALACLQDLDLVDAPGTQTADAMSWDKVKEVVRNPTWPDWLGRLSRQGRKIVKKANKTNLARVNGSAPDTEGLGQAVKRLTEIMKKQDKQFVGTLEEAKREGLGQYTTEQEADDLAAEWLADVGVKSDHVVEAMRRLAIGSETRMKGFVIGQKECEELWNSDWRTEDGDYRYIPIGNYTENHHSLCYRMFNLEREINAHEYRPLGKEPQPGPASWAQLQDVADGLSNPPSHEGEGVTIPAFVKESLLDCPYAPDEHTHAHAH